MEIFNSFFMWFILNTKNYLSYETAKIVFLLGETFFLSVILIAVVIFSLNYSDNKR